MKDKVEYEFEYFHLYSMTEEPENSNSKFNLTLII